MRGQLVFFCGKMGAGKSTRAQSISEGKHAVLISEDIWLSHLYPGEIKSLEDYITCSARLKFAMKDHVLALLSQGLSVIMDFPGNTKSQRSWFRELIDLSGAEHQLVYLDVPNEVCLQQIAERAQKIPERALFDTEEVFHQVTAYFEPPEASEGFDVVVNP